MPRTGTKRTQDDVINEALAVHARNEAKKRKKRTSKRTTEKKPAPSDFLPTTSEEDEASVVDRPVTKKRRTDYHLIAKEMAESGKLFGGTAIPPSSAKKKETKSPSPSKLERKRPPQPDPKDPPPSPAYRPASRLAPPRPAPAVRTRITPAAALHEEPARKQNRLNERLEEIPRHNEVIAEDVTDDDDTEMHEELMREIPEVADDEVHPPAASHSLWVIGVSLLVAVVSVLITVVPRILSGNKLDVEEITVATFSLTLQGLVSAIKIVMKNLWRLAMKLGRVWGTCLKEHPLSTLALTLFCYFLTFTLYRYKVRKRRDETLRTRVVATRNKVYQELYKTHQPISREIIFARIAFEEFPASGVRRNAFRSEIWSHVEPEVEGDPRVAVERIILSGRSVVHWSWVDTNPPHGA